MKFVLKSLILLGLLVAHAPLAQADVSPLVNYQGYLEIDGEPVANAAPTNYRIEFYIYDAATGGNVIWGETQTVTVYRGVFNTLLGAGDPIGLDGEGAPDPPKPPLVDAFSSDQRWLTFVVPALSLNELSVRQQVASSPQALVAQRVVESAISSTNVADRSIGGIDLAEGTITGFEVANESLTGGDIADRSIGGIDLVVGTVGSTELLDGNVLSVDIGNFTILAEDIADNAVDGRGLAGNSVSSGHIVDGQVTGADIADRTITHADIAVNSIGGAELIDETVTVGKMGTGAVDSRVIADGTVGYADVADKLGAGQFRVWTREDETGLWGGVNDWHHVTDGSGIITHIYIAVDEEYRNRASEQWANTPTPGFYIRIDGVHVYGPFANYRIDNATATAVNGGGVPAITGHHASGLEHVISIAPFLKFASKVEIRQSTAAINGGLRAAIQISMTMNP
jgi:hypothetical protein